MDQADHLRSPGHSGLCTEVASIVVTLKYYLKHTPPFQSIKFKAFWTRPSPKTNLTQAKKIKTGLKTRKNQIEAKYTYQMAESLMNANL